MGDKPFFPAPGAARPAAAPAPASHVPVSGPVPVPESAPVPPRVPSVVARPDPPPIEDGPIKAGAALSRTEMKALLAVGAELQRGSGKRKAWKRGRLIVVPTGLVSTVIHIVLGDYAIPLILVLCLGSILWVARPLLGRDEWS